MRPLLLPRGQAGLRLDESPLTHTFDRPFGYGYFFLWGYLTAGPLLVKPKLMTR